MAAADPPGLAAMAPGGGAAPVARPRDPVWDTAKFIAITLVVVGHTIERYADSRLMYALYLFIYSFHMPMFAFISGRFSSSAGLTARSARSMIRTLIAPYVIFSVIWWFFGHVSDKPHAFDLTAPYWYLWFLVALVAWRLTLPLFAVIRFPVTVAVIIAVAAGYFPAADWHMAISRTLVFLPFFVAGWRTSGGLRLHRGFLAGPVAKIAAAALLPMAAAACYVWAPQADALALRPGVQGATPYVNLDWNPAWAGALRLALMMLAFVLIFAALSLTPRRAPRLADWGTRTMTVYIAHLFVIVAFTTWEAAFGWFDSAWKFAILVLAAIVLSVMLSARSLDRLLRPLIRPRLTWLVRYD
ncbi:acyltransferase family protein [Rarobacter incanus]|uniref:Fucose 4-O-acetylase-like acetyltransferase n=1 Tax=Rarobacter incanus TaxID=153494 RepID=A0A542SNN3_9MICO|nr:acyltransferase family protein [Rarobacter incanus]TQK76230.1 fucose 4-O-acetylase-like acetyltransferase [Rarobacter incanus]